MRARDRVAAAEASGAALLKRTAAAERAAEEARQVHAEDSKRIQTLGAVVAELHQLKAGRGGHAEAPRVARTALPPCGAPALCPCVVPLRCVAPPRLSPASSVATRTVRGRTARPGGGARSTRPQRRPPRARQSVSRLIPIR